MDLGAGVGEGGGASRRAGGVVAGRGGGLGRAHPGEKLGDCQSQPAEQPPKVGARQKVSKQTLLICHLFLLLIDWSKMIAILMLTTIQYTIISIKFIHFSYEKPTDQQSLSSKAACAVTNP